MTAKKPSAIIKKINIILLESNRLLREGLATTLRGEKDIEFVAFGNYEAALEKAPTFVPNVLLIDVGINKLNCLEIIALFKKKYHALIIVVMNLAPLHTSILDFVKAGTTGFITKAATTEDFLRTVRAAYKGEKVLPQPVTDSLFSQILENGMQNNQINIISESVHMTTREQEIVSFVAIGLSNKEIADTLNISVQTVKTHVHNILEKMSLRSRLELANFVYTNGNGDGAIKEDGFLKGDTTD